MTNASDAVGRAVAMALGEAGAQVLVHHFRGRAMAAQIVERILAAGGKAQATAVDLASAEGPRELAHHARAVIGDRLDILVFNAVPPRAALRDFDRELAANLRAPFLLVQQLLPVMNSGACLVFSMAPASAPAEEPALLAIRGGLAALAIGLETSLRPRGVRVDALIARPRSCVGEETASVSQAFGRSADIARAVTALVTSR